MEASEILKASLPSGPVDTVIGTFVNIMSGRNGGRNTCSQGCNFGLPFGMLFSASVTEGERKGREPDGVFKTAIRKVQLSDINACRPAVLAYLKLKKLDIGHKQPCSYVGFSGNRRDFEDNAATAVCDLSHGLG